MVNLRKLLGKDGKGGETASVLRGKTLEDAVKADVALRLLGQRIKELEAFVMPIDVQGKSSEESLTSQLVKMEAIASLFHGEIGELYGVSPINQRAWKRVLAKLKIAERKYGYDHPWTQLLFEIAYSIAVDFVYRSIARRHTDVEIVRMPPEYLSPFGQMPQIPLGKITIPTPTEEKNEEGK
jgi:hypothetical protein